MIIHFKKVCLVFLKHDCFLINQKSFDKHKPSQSQVGEHSIKLHSASARELTDASLIANTEKPSSLVTGRPSHKQSPPNKYCILTNEGFPVSFLQSVQY